MAITEPIRNKKQVRELTEYYLKRGEIRNYVLIVLGIHTALRISDILRLTWDDVYDFDNNRIMKNITVTEKKTGKSKIVALHKDVVIALSVYSTIATPHTPLILSEKTNGAISRVQAYRIICSAAKACEFQSRVSCHSLRKTFGYHTWKGGVSPAIIMEIYNHSSLAVTRRYLGVTQDEKNSAYLKLDFTK